MPLKVDPTGTGPVTLDYSNPKPDLTIPLKAYAVKADGANGEISYKWYHITWPKYGGTPACTDDNIIAGATGATYTIAESLAPGYHRYCCVVTCDGMEYTTYVNDFLTDTWNAVMNVKIYDWDDNEITTGECTTKIIIAATLKDKEGNNIIVNQLDLNSNGHYWGRLLWDAEKSYYKTEFESLNFLIDPGIHSYSVKFNGNNEYGAIETSRIALNVSKATQAPITGVIRNPSCEGSTKYGGTYDGLFFQYNGGSVEHSWQTYTVPEGNGVLIPYPNYNSNCRFKIVGAGTVMVTVTNYGNDTYSDVTGTCPFTIEKGDAPTITFPTVANLTYGQKLSASLMTGGSNEYGTFEWTDGTITPAVGSTSYELKFIPNADTIKNYETIANTTKTYTVSVAKATPAVSVNATVSGTSGNRTATLTATVTGADGGETPSGTLQFVDTTSGSDVNIDSPVDISAGKVTYTWTGLANQIYKIKAVYSGSGNYITANSEELSFDTSKQNQSALSIGSIGTKTYGDSSFALSATGGSGTGDVTFTSSDPTIVSISGTTATIHKAGDVTINATKAEDENYNEVISSIVLNIDKKALAVKADDKLNIIKGATMPEFTYTETGLVDGDTFTAPEITTTATDTNTVGEYDITISGGTLSNADNYNVTYTKGKLTVVNATYAVTVTNGTGDGSYSEGQLVTITADSRSGYTFTGWSSSDGVTFTSTTASTTTFTMPGKAVTITANYSANDSGNSGGSTTPSGNTSTDVSENKIVIKETPNSINHKELVRIEEVGNAFSQPVEIIIKDDSAAKNIILENLKDMYGSSADSMTIFALDISVVAKGTDTKVQLNAGTSVTITYPIPKSLIANKDKIKVVCIIDGKLIVLETKLVSIDGVHCVRFTAKHFSPYAMVVDTTNALDNTDKVETTETATDENPKTGNSNSVVTFSLIAIMSVTTLTVVSKKRKFRVIKKV